MSIIKSNKSWFRQLSYDIVKAHGGELKVEDTTKQVKEVTETTFIILILVANA